jgi:hypothetical protein
MPPGRSIFGTYAFLLTLLASLLMCVEKVNPTPVSLWLGRYQLHPP